jgi:hypothetical protein
MTQTGIQTHMSGPRRRAQKTLQKTSSKKHKKQAHDSEHQLYSILAIHKKVTREYLAQSSTHTVDDEALTTELRSASRAFALQEAERARNVVIPTPQFTELHAAGELELWPLVSLSSL